MNFYTNATDIEIEFSPLEHPTEPSEEDKPVKCPMSYSSAANNNRESEQQMMHDSLRKRTEFSATTINRGRISIELGEPPAQAVRKRHHPLSRGDNTLPTTLRAPAPPHYRRSTSSLPSAMSFVRFNKFGT